MTTNVLSLQSVLDSIVRLGAKICVIADLNGLTIATSSSLKDHDREQALSALSSIVIPAGETAGRELFGDFNEIIIRTDQEVIVAISLGTDPNTAVMAISDKSFERMLAEILQEKLVMLKKSVDGQKLDSRQASQYINREQKVTKFFDSLIERVKSSSQIDAVIKILNDASDEYSSSAVGSWTTYPYKFNSFAREIKSMVRSNPEISVDEVIMMTQEKIKTWRKEALKNYTKE